MAISDSSATAQDTPVTIEALANDSNPDGLGLSLAISQVPTNGTAQVNADRTLTYALAAGFVGTDTFAYTISDTIPGGQSTAQVVVTVNPGPQIVYAAGESSVAAKVAGSYADTRQSDDRYESLTEVAQRKKNVLDHTWIFSLAPTSASAVTFNVEAWHDGTEDDFLFQYSLNGTDWITMLTITKTSDDNTAQTYGLPANLTGTVYVRVLDTNRAVNKKTIDRLYIDQLFIRCA